MCAFYSILTYNRIPSVLNIHMIIHKNIIYDKLAHKVLIISC